MRAGNDHRPLRLGFSPSGGLVDLNLQDDDAARDQAKEESRRQVREANEADRAVEAAHSRESKRLRDEAGRREIPPGVPG